MANNGLKIEASFRFSEELVPCRGRMTRGPVWAWRRRAARSKP